MPIQITAEDFGPISKGTISARPLTVFIGQNNSGKSFFAMLTYAVHLARRWRVPYLARGRGRRIYISRAVYDRKSASKLEAHIEAFASELQSGGSGIDFTKMPTPIVAFLREAVRNSLQHYAAQIGAEMERCFGSKLRDLARARNGSAGFFVSVSHSAPRWSVRMTIKAGRPHGEVTKEPSMADIFRQMRGSGPPRRWDRLKSMPKQIFLEELVENCVEACFSEYPRDCYYLPAARSGILQSHKALASFVMSRSPLAGIEDMEIPKMTGVITDFITYLLEMEPDGRPKFEALAKYLESDVLDGAVAIRSQPHAYPEISYEAGQVKLPLHRTSSMVSELAPVVLFLRYLVDPGEMLIIEEPESHLHPSSQLKFARAVARLINGGVAVVLTTHSDYFLSELNNSIRAGSLGSEARKANGFADQDCILADQVSAYLFQRPGQTSGTEVHSIKVTAQSAISEKEFGRVAEALYTETVDLKRSTMAGAK